MAFPDEKRNPVSTERRASPWTAFRHTTFAVVWIATVVSNVGTWMYNAASGWLMTSLDSNPLTVSLVQVATSLPMFLFALPAGALADIVDKRRFLIISEIRHHRHSGRERCACVARLDQSFGSFAVYFSTRRRRSIHRTSMAVSRASACPEAGLSCSGDRQWGWVNISRAVGPALAGVIIGGIGIAAPFWINALSNFAVIGALLWWRPASSQGTGLPPERLTERW